jgi:V8-like Glu-specific endopeptidase
VKRTLLGALLGVSAAASLSLSGQVASAQAVPAQLPAKPAPGGKVQVTSHVVTAAEKATTSYWTAARMKAATPLRSRQSSGATPNTSIPTATHFGGDKRVGTLFSNNGSGPHYCTASVVNTGQRNTLLTAAHCLYNPSKHTFNKNVLYVPQYTPGRFPYGAWPVSFMAVDKRWSSHGDVDLDFGFAKVVQPVQARTGGFGLAINQGYTNQVVVYGYPDKKDNPTDRPIYCYATTHKFPPSKYQLYFDCKGYYGGVSGGPWVKTYKGQQWVMGVIGGYQQGGAADWRSYTSVFDSDIMNLYRWTTSH